MLNVPGTFDSKMFSSAPAASAENGKDVDDYDAAYGLLSETGSMTSDHSWVKIARHLKKQ